jgi:dihydrofolate reductase
MIKTILATASNGVIGRENDLPWKLPSDMAHFKKITSGHSVLMGRKCWESIPEKFRPLPNRKNYVLTRDKNYVAKGAHVVHSLEDMIKKYKHSSEVLFIIGGAELYDETFEHASSMFLTTIFSEVDGDVRIKKLDLNKWVMTDFSELIIENGFDYSISHYVKK